MTLQIIFVQVKKTFFHFLLSSTNFSLIVFLLIPFKKNRNNRSTVILMLYIARIDPLTVITRAIFMSLMVYYVPLDHFTNPSMGTSVHRQRLLKLPRTRLYGSAKLDLTTLFCVCTWY